MGLMEKGVVSHFIWSQLFPSLSADWPGFEKYTFDLSAPKFTSSLAFNPCAGLSSFDLSAACFESPILSHVRAPNQSSLLLFSIFASTRGLHADLFCIVGHKAVRYSIVWRIGIWIVTQLGQHWRNFVHLVHDLLDQGTAGCQTGQGCSPQGRCRPRWSRRRGWWAWWSGRWTAPPWTPSP